MTLAPTVRLRIYPDDCDAYGHVNQAAFLRLFERGRWEALAQGPGIDLFTRGGCWPAIRRATVDYHGPSFPGEELDFTVTLTHLGRSSFTMQQVARKSGRIVATGQFVAVCIDGDGKPVEVPRAIPDALGTRPPVPGPAPRFLGPSSQQLATEQTGDGPAVLFVHGFPMDRTMWRALAARLAGWHRIAPDLPGFGLSDPAPFSAAGMSPYADSLVRLLDQLEVERAVVCGLSMGGYVAFEIWRRHRARVRGLILVNTRAEPDGEEARAGRDRTARHVRDEGLVPLARAMVPRLLAPATHQGAPETVNHVRTMILDNQVEGAIDALGAMRDRADFVPMLADIDVPVLVLAGEEDSIVPVESARVMSKTIPGARLEIVPRAGHVVPLEATERAAQLVAGFLGDLR